MDDLAEITQTIERLQTVFEELTIRGLRSTGTQDQNKLRSLHEELRRIGADHLAERVAQLLEAIINDDRKAAACLLRAQTSLRLLERILTLEVAEATLAPTIPEE